MAVRVASLSTVPSKRRLPLLSARPSVASIYTRGALGAPAGAGVSLPRWQPVAAMSRASAQAKSRTGRRNAREWICGEWIGMVSSRKLPRQLPGERCERVRGRVVDQRFFAEA
jgi:hypothetical protein